MKQIFDWLREQMNETIELNCKRLKHDESLMCHDRNFGIKQALCKVDEAEAKWEGDCCEWIFEKDLVVFQFIKLAIRHNLITTIVIKNSAHTAESL